MLPSCNHSESNFQVLKSRPVELTKEPKFKQDKSAGCITPRTGKRRTGRLGYGTKVPGEIPWHFSTVEKSIASFRECLLYLKKYRLVDQKKTAEKRSGAIMGLPLILFELVSVRAK